MLSWKSQRRESLPNNVQVPERVSVRVESTSPVTLKVLSAG